MNACHASRMLLTCFAVAAASPAFAEGLALPSRGETLRHLKREHPRLLASAATFESLRSNQGEGSRAAQWQERLHAEAVQLLAAAPVKYEIPDGKRLLAVSRRAKERVLLLGMVYQLTSDKRFAERAWTELDAVIRFPDWNPSHFLDTAEMTCAVAFGYDWMFAAWSEERRLKLREAIVQFGLKPGLKVYRAREGWSKSVHNWNQVCNGGLALGALAIAEDEPELADEILHAALQSLPLAMHEFRPDGGWGEGPGYWRYATEYNVCLLAALRTALGEDFGLANAPGFPVTGDFPLAFTSPIGKTFNFADAHDEWNGAPQLFWLASAFDAPDYARFQLSFADAHPTPLDLLWGSRWTTLDASPAPAQPLTRKFSGVELVAMRSAWNDPQALYVAFKGGDNRANHAHLDLGGFVLDAQGERWASDLGPDDYNLPGYFGRERWRYFRNNTQSHNTLVLNGQNQNPSARAPLVRFSNKEPTAVSNLKCN